MRGKENLKNIQKITADAFKDGLTINEVIQRDLSDIEKVNVVLILTRDTPSWGTTRIVPDFDSAVQVLLHWKKYWNGEGVHDTR